MRRRLAVLAALAVVPLLMAARPGNEYQLSIALNGQQVRLVMPDGGLSGAFGSSNTQACMPLTTLKSVIGAAVNANVFVFESIAGTVNFCIRPSIVNMLWDGGCNSGVADVNYGTPVPPNVPQYFTPDSVATHFCVVGDAGTVVVPVWLVE